MLLVAALSAALLLAAGAGGTPAPAGAQGATPTPTPTLAPFFASQTRAPGASAFFLTQTAVAPRGATGDAPGAQPHGQPQPGPADRHPAPLPHARLQSYPPRARPSRSSRGRWPGAPW